MADSLIDFGEIARLAQNNVQNAIQLGWMMQRDDRNNIQQQQVELHQRQVDLEQQRLRQSSTFRAFDELDKLANSPQFATPMQQIDLRYTQGKLIQEGLGVKVPMPSREEMVGAYEQFADNIKQFRQNADPAVRRQALQNLVLAAPQYGMMILEALKKAGELDVQGEELMTMLATNKAKLQALNVQAGRTTMQQGLFSENLGALAQAMQIPDDPKFQKPFKALQDMNPQAQQVYLKQHPQFEQAFQQAMQPHLARLGALPPEYEEQFGEDAKPKYLGAIDDQMQQLMQAKNEAVEQTGEVPTGLQDQILGLEAVRKARGLQYAWMRDPFNKEKFTAAQQARADLGLLSNAAGKTLTGIQSERDSIAQTKFTADQQEKLASDYAQEQYKKFLDKGYNENRAAVLAAKETQTKYPDTPYNADKLKSTKPLVENKIDVGGKAEQAYSTEFNKQMAQKDSDLYEHATNAQNIYDRASRVIDILQNQKTITGIGAEWRLGLAKAMKLAGLSDSDAAENTEVLFTELASNTLDQVKASGLGSGTGFSNTDREYLEKAKAGKIQLEKGTMMRVARISQRVQQLTVDRWNKRAKQLPASALQGGGVTNEPIILTPTKPSSGKTASPQPGGAVLKTLPQGSTQIGTSGGKPVYQDASGKRWIGE